MALLEGTSLICYTAWLCLKVAAPHDSQLSIIPTLGHENNAHCLAIAVNNLAGALFGFYGSQHQKERMKEFLVVGQSTLTPKSPNI